MLSNANQPAGSSVLTGKRHVLAGVDIGGTKTAVCLSAEVPDLLWRREFATRPEAGPEHALQSIVDLLHQGLVDTGTSLSAIGVSCGGPLDSIAGVVQRPPNLSTWDNVPVTALLTERFGVPCALENDANAGALAEHRFGAGRGTEHMVFLTLGTGLGAGLILNNQLYRGASHLAGEIGHVRLTEYGPVGYGKQGSVEGWASGSGMAKVGTAMLRDVIAYDQQSLLNAHVEDLSARDIAAALQAGDQLAEQIVQASARRLGEALAIVVDIINPQRIVMGGLALRLGEHLLAPARAVLDQQALPAAASACDLVPAQLGESIGDVAALCIALTAAPSLAAPLA